ncbi:MAG: hypothetical protein ABR562_08205 [Thermoplasmatota archaeon]
MADKPAILQDSRFTVEEGIGYRAARTGAIWMNKLFFSSLVLLGIWLIWAFVAGSTGCVEGVPQAPAHLAGDCSPDGPSTCNPDQGNTTQCNAFLTPTAKYLAAMSVISFVLSIAFGLLGLIFGKRIVEATPAAEEVGARKDGPNP